MIDKQWLSDIEKDASSMSAYDFAYKHGKYNLPVWDRVNKVLPQKLERELCAVLSQIKLQFEKFDDIRFPKDTKSKNMADVWVGITKEKISDLLLQISNKSNK